MIGAPAGNTLPLRLMEEFRILELVKRARRSAHLRCHGRFQLWPALVAPMVAWKLARLTGCGQANDSSTEFTRTANRGVHRRPALSEAKVVCNKHLTVAYETQLLADGIALMHGKETFEAVHTNICVRKLESLRITSLDRRVGQYLAHSLQVIYYKMSPGAFECKMRKSLRCQIHWIVS